MFWLSVVGRVKGLWKVWRLFKNRIFVFFAEMGGENRFFIFWGFYYFLTGGQVVVCYWAGFCVGFCV
jgi:hypothetical protein